MSLSVLPASAAADRPYDRSQWFDPKTPISDDLRRVPVPKGYGDHTGKMVLTGGRLLDGTGAAAYPATVLIEGKKITALLKPDDTDYPEGAKVLDLQGKTIMPGLIDLHVHITYLKHFGLPPATSSQSQADAALRGQERLQYYLKSGITTVRDVGSHGMAPFILKKYIDGGQISGPRIFSAGQVIVGKGGHGTEGFYLATAPTYPDAIAIEASGADEWRDAVRLQFKRGADLIKLASHYSPEEIQAAVDEAHRLGLRVTVDAETQFIDMAIDAGVDVIEHPLPRSRRAIRLMKKKGIASVPTLVPYQQINERGGYVGSTSRRFSLSNQSIFEMALSMKKEGIPLGIGTDLVLELYKQMPGPYLQELNNFRELGYSNLEVLSIATKVNAEILGMADRIGTLEVGKLADLIVIDGKPDKRLEDLAKVERVIVNGKLVHSDQ